MCSITRRAVSYMYIQLGNAWEQGYSNSQLYIANVFPFISLLCSAIAVLMHHMQWKEGLQQLLGDLHTSHHET